MHMPNLSQIGIKLTKLWPFTFCQKVKKMWKNHEKYSFSAIKAQIMKIYKKVKNKKTPKSYNASFDEKWVMSYEISQRYSQSKMAAKMSETKGFTRITSFSCKYDNSAKKQFKFGGWSGMHMPN